MSRRRKPLGWPRYMVARQLKSGVGYYWVPPTWAKRDGCPLGVEALGTDYGDAKKRCDEVLNLQFDAWRKRDEVPLPAHRAAPGTFDWMVTIYKSAPQYQKLFPKTRRDYDFNQRIHAEEWPVIWHA